MSRKQSYRRQTAFLAVLGLVLLLSSSLKDSLAYFTTYTTTRGSARLTIGPRTEIEEAIERQTKQIQIENTGETDCFVRTRIYAGSLLLLTESEVVPEGGSSHWRKDADGWWYYEAILRPGEKTNVLSVKIDVTKEMMNQKIDNFNVVVVQESTPVLYREDGTPYADWELSIKSEERGGAGS